MSPVHPHDEIMTQHITQLANLGASCDQNKSSVGECKEGIRAMGERITKLERDVDRINIKLALWTSGAVFISQFLVTFVQRLVNG